MKKKRKVIQYRERAFDVYVICEGHSKIRNQIPGFLSELLTALAVRCASCVEAREDVAKRVGKQSGTFQSSI